MWVSIFLLVIFYMVIYSCSRLWSKRGCPCQIMDFQFILSSSWQITWHQHISIIICNVLCWNIDTVALREREGVSNYQQVDGLFNRLFMLTTKIIKAPHHWSFVFPPKGQLCRKRFDNDFMFQLVFHKGLSQTEKCTNIRINVSYDPW